MRLPCTLAILLALGSSAQAGSDVGVVVTGEGSMQPQLAAQIENWLAQHGHTLVPTPLPPEVIPTLGDCFVLHDPLGCIRHIIETRAKTTSLIYARLETTSNPSNGTRDVTLTAYFFDKGHDAVAERKTCERCTDQALRTTADEVMKRLVGGTAVGHVKLKSTPAGARISIDGKPIGVTPLDWDLPPGAHEIRMDKPGLEADARQIVVVSDRTDTVALELFSTGEARGWRRAVPLAALATGGALIVTGAVLYAIDQDDGFDQPKRIRDTAPLGIGLAIGGAVVGGIGAYLWLRSPGPSSAPVAIITRDTAYLGWLGRF
jgi:hypothetical protein